MMKNLTNLELLIQQYCRDAGFPSYGFTSPVLDDKYRKHLETWLSSGNQADMNWMKKNVCERTDLTIRFPWVKSVLVVAENYFSDYPNRHDEAVIARYSRGEDYHRILEQKLKKLLTKLKMADSSIIGKTYVDTSAVLEKAFAVSAGLGWQGKNATIIIENVGSFCFLGVLLLNREFPVGAETPNRCGSCEKCLKSCPGNAISEPGFVDARKCNAYLTIEKKGNFSNEEKSGLQKCLYGCDICQSACPWNHLWAKQATEIRYFNHSEMLDRSLFDWEKLTVADFQDFFKDSPIHRLKYDRFRRNITALRNL